MVNLLWYVSCGRPAVVGLLLCFMVVTPPVRTHHLFTRCRLIILSAQIFANRRRFCTFVFSALSDPFIQRETSVWARAPGYPPCVNDGCRLGGAVHCCYMAWRCQLTSLENSSTMPISPTSLLWTLHALRSYIWAARRTLTNK